MPALLELVNFSLSTGSAILFEGVDAVLTEGQRVALVGPNGSGKSTLLRALAAPADDEGSYFVVGAGSVGGTLGPDNRPQDSVFFVEQDALQWARLLRAAECEEHELLELTLPEALELASAGASAAALEDAEAWRSTLVAAYDALEWRTAAYDETPLGELSPGCAVRAYLSIVLQRRDVKLLLLDEPTNHLDLPTVLWLQHALLASGKAVVMVSHDRPFLDAVADHVWDIDPMLHTLTVSGASYAAYCHAKEIAREKQRAAYEAQQKRHKRLSSVAENLRAASASGARHVAKDHDTLQRDFKRDRAGRSGRKAKAIETRRDSEATVERLVERTPLHIDLDPLAGGSDASIILSYVTLGYEDRALPLPPLTVRIDFGERIAIVGFNGVGKSTLLRTITGAIPPVTGEVSVGRELRIGNLMQEHESLPRDKTPREYLAKCTGLTAFNAGQCAIGYGLSRYQVDQPIGELNPGARARLLLSTFSIRKANALILDEPSNHLDQEAIEEVIATLNCYTGTVVVVSHNREFLESLQLSRTLRLSAGGITEIESIADFVDVTEDAVRSVVAACFPA